MVNDTELPRIYKHCAVRLDNFIIIFGGSLDLCGIHPTPFSTDVIWRYNLYTDKWDKQATTTTRESPKPFDCAVAVLIEGIIYTFGGESEDFERNELWTLSRTETGDFTWSFIKNQCDKESPSPRQGHTGWEYEGKLWVFGGRGPSPHHYLNNHGDIEGDIIRNNQLLSYNPKTSKWTNPQCFGEVPSPRSGICSSSTIIREKVYLFGGYIGDVRGSNDFFQLNMYSATWTRIQTVQRRPPTTWDCTLTAATDNQLVLSTTSTGAWVMDLTSLSWRMLYTSRDDHGRDQHTATLGLNSNVIFVRGYLIYTHGYNNIFHVMLEPMSLQKLTVCTIYKHQGSLSWERLPKKLIAVLGISDKRQGSVSSSSSSCVDHTSTT